MLLTPREGRFYRTLRQLPYNFHFRYTEKAHQALQQTLFRSLVGENDEYLHGLFLDRIPRPGEEWSLSKAQGITEDMEYTEAARGKPCGHIFKGGDSVFRCKTCTTDETAVLCTRCFEASDHADHIVTQSISLGNSGCCDCGDEEAWRIPVNCAIHSTGGPVASGKSAQSPSLPDELLTGIRTTIARALDYVLDVISCSPENLRLPKTEEKIRLDEEKSRLASAWYNDNVDCEPEFALVLWNDEKHTIHEVEEQVKRACKERRAFGRQKADETNDYGRSVVEYSTNVRRLLRIAAIIEQIKITVTIRSSRDTFREQMCTTIIEFLKDIAGCSVGHDHNILQRTICEEMYREWRKGSKGSNMEIGKSGLDDHEIEEDDLRPPRGFFARGGNIILNLGRGPTNNDSDSDSLTNDNDEDDEDDEDDEEHGDGSDLSQPPLVETAAGADPMDLDVASGTTPRPSDDHEMRAPNDLEEGAEVSEATFAGYPPPPPPPPAPSEQGNGTMSQGPRTNVARSSMPLAPFAPATNIDIPLAPKSIPKRNRLRTPQYWLQQPEQSLRSNTSSLVENLEKRIRLDHLLLFDLRLWKKIRIDLRDLYITSLLASNETRRIFGLRFAGLYAALGQLYLIADREPDLSVVNLSVQTFTVPSVTQDVIQKGNFLTTLFSMLYTFLTQRTVMRPWQVSVDDSLASENNSVSNRRMYHFFTDLRHMFHLDYVGNQLRSQERYQLQFLDLIRLPQGICPNVRYVGDHVEYENDVWISAQFLTKDINKLIRQVAEIFRDDQDPSDCSHLQRFIRSTAKAVIVNSMGGERVRFDQAEIKFETRFKTLEPYHFERCIDSSSSHSVVDFVVEREAISFHHPLHNMLSWLIDCGKGMHVDQLRKLLSFTLQELRQPPPFRPLVPDQQPEDYLMAAFDFPLRVCAWLAQMKAGMWVRNGLSLRHQMSTYRGMAHRDLAHHRDIFLLQTALVTCNPSRVLASIVDRFGMDQWMRGNYIVREGLEATQQIDVAEDFVHLLIVILSDRSSLYLFDNIESARAAAMRRDLSHILCFKPLSFSDLESRFADKAGDLEDHQDILEEMTVFKPPEGMSDTGSFELRSEYMSDVDPYAAHYTKNQRDEAENAYRDWVSKRSGKPLADIVYEPKLTPIEKGLFVNLTSFTTKPLFAQIVFYSLFLGSNTHRIPEIPATRIEAYMRVVLHLTLLVVLEEKFQEKSHQPSTAVPATRRQSSFITHALHSRSELGLTIVDLLAKMLESSILKNCQPHIRLILRRIKQTRPAEYQSAIIECSGGTGDTLVERMDFESPMTPGEDEEEARLQEDRRLKKQQALERQARVMAQFQQQQQNFLKSQDVVDWEEDDNLVLAGTVEDQTKIWRYPSGNCILCQEETNDGRLYGTFGMMMMSNIFRQTDAKDPDFVAEVLSTPDSLDRSSSGFRPFGVASSNRSKITKRSSLGEEVEMVHQGLAKGFPSAFATQGSVSTGCGHIMHYNCFETYCAATQRRQNHQIARQHPERTGSKEFLCPLCKALGNSFLPIVWKGKEEISPRALETELDFDEWLSSQLGLNVTRFLKSREGTFDNERLQETFTGYLSRTLLPSLQSSVSGSANSVTTTPTSPQSTAQSWYTVMPRFWTSEQEVFTSSVQAESDDIVPVTELKAAYDRLKETLKVNRLSAQSDLGSGGGQPYPEPRTCSETLARMLGWSITTTEIAQRGTQAEQGVSLLDQMSTSTLTHLRILAETTSSFMALEVKTADDSNVPLQEISECSKRQVLQLFAGHPHVGQDMSRVLQSDEAPALMQDPFVLLVECCTTMARVLNIEIFHVLQLCYILEIVKATLYLVMSSSLYRENPVADKFGSAMSMPQELPELLRKYLSQLSRFSLTDPSAKTGIDVTDTLFDSPANPDWYPMFFKAITRYALVFVRKATIFMHVKFGVGLLVTDLAGLDGTELQRLSHSLHLPSLLDIFASLSEYDNIKKSALQSVIGGWITHWHHSQTYDLSFDRPLSSDHVRTMCSDAAYRTLRPGHPCIFELIGLPKHFDTLTYEASRRRCLTKGTKMEDPNICLFCGEFFCGQALCCTKHGKGGCFQHMQKCGVSIGLFINIRKCTALYMHSRNGSWGQAPYLDRYGEPDSGLRHGRQLSLSQKRYDKLLRDVWLQQAIPTTVARKLEAEINNGGWETL